MSGGDVSEDGAAVSDGQTAAAAAAAAIGNTSQLAHAVNPALGYYLLPGYQSPYSSGVYSCCICAVQKTVPRRDTTGHVKCRWNIFAKMSALHWLPISQRISFKIALMMFDCSRSQCPKYFDDVYALVHTVAARS